MNQGLILLSPLVLVRLLTVEEFGQFREFLLYVTMLGALASLGFSNSLLYFIPADPLAGRQLLRQTAAMTFVGSIAVVGLALLADVLAQGALLGAYRWPVLLYVLCFVNVDFWEFYWLARRRPVSALAYASGRLVLRMTVVIAAAALTGDVNTIIWAIVVFEAVRLATSALLWRRHVRDMPARSQGTWREQLRYCLPLGGATFLVILNRSLGNLAVAKFMGVVALAHYTVGTQIQPIVTVLRNSLSDSLLPEMVARRADTNDPLALWRRTTVVSMLLLVPVGLVLMEFAEPLVTSLFTSDYLAAVPVFQLYALVLLREVFDFGVPLRAANRTAPIARSNLLAVVLTVVLLAILLPPFGLIGAVTALVVSRFADGLYLAHRTCHQYRIPLRALADWRDLGKVALACAAGSLVFIGSFWTDHFGLAGVVIGSLAFFSVVSAALIVMQLPEVLRLLHGLKPAPSAVPPTH